MTSMPRPQSWPALEMNHDIEQDDLRERLEVLLLQEQRHYLCEDYIHSREKDLATQAEPCPVVLQCARVVSDLAFSTHDEAMQTAFPSSACVKDLAVSQVNVSFVRDEKAAASSKLVGFWRQQMVDWSYLVMDSFGIDRDVVAVSFNILDRYVAKETKSNIPITREDFQLFSMTSLFIGVKLLETFPRKLTADALVDMSRGFYAAEDILHTEQEILKTLGFYLNPTTAIGFCQIYWEMFPLPVSFEFKAHCQSIAEAALSDTFFMTRRPSRIGLAATLLAAREAGHDIDITQHFVMRVKDMFNSNSEDDFDLIHQRLELLSHK